MRNITLIALAVAVAAPAHAINITFDEAGLAPNLFSNANPLRNEYAGLGVFFAGPTVLGGGAILNDITWNVQATSGRNFLAINQGAVMANGGIASLPQAISFSTLQASASIRASGDDFDTNFSMKAYRAGNLVETDLEFTAMQTWTTLSVSVAGGFDTLFLDGVNQGGLFLFDDFNATPVPEPATMAVLAAGAFAMLRRRKKA